jgi:hypothetical protein
VILSIDRIGVNKLALLPKRTMRKNIPLIPREFPSDRDFDGSGTKPLRSETGHALSRKGGFRRAKNSLLAL